MTYLLDTSILVHFLRGNDETKTLLKTYSEHGSFAISVITYGELLYGARRSSSYTRESERIRSLIDDFRIAVFQLTLPVIDVYAYAKFTCEHSGSKLDELDLLIGATAVASEASLITDNKRHFRRFPGITLVK